MSELIVSAYIYTASAGRNDLIGWNDQLANTGVFLLRSGPATQAMLEEWWLVPTRDRATAFQWPVEQLGFNRHILPKYHKQIALVDYSILGGMDTTFIRHPANESLSHKAEIQRQEQDRLRTKYGW